MGKLSCDGYAMLMRLNEAKSAVHGYHCPDGMAVRMRKVLARPWVGVCYLLLLLFLNEENWFHQPKYSAPHKTDLCFVC